MSAKISVSFYLLYIHFTYRSFKLQKNIPIIVDANISGNTKRFFHPVRVKLSSHLQTDWLSLHKSH